jgi:hypothetical protein
MPRAAHLTMRNTPVRSSATDSSTPCGDGSCASLPRRLTPAKWVVFVAMVLGAPSALEAQTKGAKASAKGQTPPVSTVPLGRFVPRDNLVVYFEFAGTNSHADSWKKTAAYRMLNETSLGEMLEAVGSQLLDKLLEFVPNHTLSGAEVVKLIKHAGAYGCVVAINANPKGGESSPVLGTIVLRGGAGKEIRPVTTLLLRRFMGAASPKIEQKGQRTLIVVPAAAQASGAAPTSGWAWWGEQTDLVVAFPAPAGADAIIAAIDGKAPTALEHPVIQELTKKEGTFEPVCIAFADPVNCPETPGGTTTLLRKLGAEWGVSRLDYRWGFDGEALMAVTRLTALKPRKGALAIFDQPTFDKATLMPRPDGVESFIELSMSPSQVLDAILALGRPDEFKAQYEEFAEAVKTAGDLDVNKDLLAYVGPRMIAYVGPGNPAATTKDSLESALKNGWSPTAAVSLLEAAFPKLTLVAEVKKPETFGKALDAAMIAINNELKAQAIEVAREARAAGDQAKGAGGGRMPGPGGTTRRRSLNETRAPSFTLIPSTSEVKTFVLMTPTDSPIRFGPSNFRPTIQLDDKYVAFAVSPDAARAALAAVRRKDWKPSANLEKACADAPSKLVMLGVIDVAESLPSLLASLPGTLQTMINTSMAVAKATAGTGAKAAAGDGPRPGAGGAGPGPGGRPGGRGGMMRAGGPGAMPTPPQGATTPGGSGSDPSSFTFKIDADKLPKSSDLKPLVFPSMRSISVTNEDIRFVSRAAFPDLSVPIGLVPLAFVMPSIRAALDKLPAAPGPDAQAAGAGAQPAAPAAGAREPAKSKMQQPGGRRGRRGAE